MRLILTIQCICLAWIGYAQSWETVTDDYNYVYDISNLGPTLFISGYQNNGGADEYFYAFSANDGDTWEEVILNDAMTVQGIPISVDFFDVLNGIVAIKSVVGAPEYLKTENGGTTWSSFIPAFNNNCSNRQPWTVQMINDTTGIIAAFQNGGYLITRDAGNTWDCNYNFSPNTIPHFTILSPSLFYTLDRDGLYFSQDKGMTWSTALEAADHNIIAYSLVDSAVGYALGQSVLNGTYEQYATTDGWNNIETLALDVFNDTYIVNMVAINENELCLFLGEEVYYSEDGGKTYAYLQSLDFELTHVAKINGEVYATGRGLVRFNPDGVVTDLSEPNRPGELIIYPNPVKGSTVRLNSKVFDRFQIYSLDGRLKEQGLINGGEIRMNQVSKGVYLLSVENANSREWAVKKIIVQ